jgi:exonuclease SbcD
MGFREALYAKKVIIADTQDNRVLPRELEVPVFQSLLRLEGDFAGISERILQLKAGGSTAWLEIELTSDELKPQLTEEIQELLAGSGLQALKIKNRNFAAHALQTGSEIRSLDDLTEEEVFENCMNDHKVAEEEREELRRAFREILQQLVL